MYFFLQSNTFICPTQLQFRFPPNLFLAIVNTHEMCHAKYSTWLYIYICIYIFLININVNKRETLIKQIGYSQVSYKIYRKKYLSSRYVFSCVICFRFIHFILISTAHALFLTCLPVSIYGT